MPPMPPIPLRALRVVLDFQSRMSRGNGFAPAVTDPTLLSRAAIDSLFHGLLTAGGTAREGGRLA